MPGGKIRYVPLHPPKDGATRTSSAAEWNIDFEQLEKTVNEKTRMIVSECPHYNSRSGQKLTSIRSSTLRKQKYFADIYSY